MWTTTSGKTEFGDAIELIVDDQLSADDKALDILNDDALMENFMDEIHQNIDGKKLIELWESINPKSTSHACNRNVLDLISVIEECIKNA